MSPFENLQIVRKRPGVITVVVDAPGRSVNVLNENLLRELATLVSELERDRELNLVVFRGGRDTGFVAGADIEQLTRFTTPAEVEVALRAGQELFDRIAALRMLTVAVIHGPCLGGGLELALACQFRVARTDRATRLGLPETQLGIIPGWGGTLRLPRVVGLEQALKMILGGEQVPAAKALAIGLVDEIAPSGRFEDAVEDFLVNRLAGKPVRRPKRKWLTRLRDDSAIFRRIVLKVARRRLGLNARHYPALPAALRAVETGVKRDHVRALAIAREEFIGAFFTPACRSLLGLFTQRERARKTVTWVSGADGAPQPIETLAVIGAGRMGSGIAQLAASHGLNVVIKDLSPELVTEGLNRVDSLLKNALGKGFLSAEEQAHARQLIAGTTEWEPVARADVAIEAVVERLDVKQDVFRELDRRAAPAALFTSNTSSLSIGDLAAVTGRPSHVAGLHFFNPVHRMPLVEVVKANATSPRTIATLVELVREMGKVPVVVADRPGFLVNRVLGPYLDEAVRMVCEGVSPEVVDRAAREFGMPLGPLELLDQVGLDVASDVSRVLAPLHREAGPTQARLEAMVARGRLGKNAGVGFYHYHDGHKPGVAAWADKMIPKRAPATRPFFAKAAAEPEATSPAQAVRFANGESLDDISQRLILPLLDAAAQALADQIVPEAWMVDLAMVLGTGFAPFRGGPLRLIDEWGTGHVVTALERLAQTCGPRFQPCDLLREMQRNDRRFFSRTEN
ncbi:MAG: 3-hydroxyacyl-CoA dehydrogenase NAD-binding domain-containing protein [Planctomycetaceae bacterium]